MLTGIAASWIFAVSTKGSLGVITLPVGHALILGALLALAGVIGDLFESELKRTSNIKDSGTILPGHGGILDRIDALLFVAPVAYLFIRYIF